MSLINRYLLIYRCMPRTLTKIVSTLLDCNDVSLHMQNSDKYFFELASTFNDDFILPTPPILFWEKLSHD